MRNILTLIMAFMSLVSYGQNKKLSELSTRSTMDGTEYVYIIYAGTSYKMLSSEWLAAVNDTADLLRSALEDTASDLRDAINDIGAGTSYWNADYSSLTTMYTVYPKIGSAYPNIYVGGMPPDPNSYGFYVAGNRDLGVSGGLYSLGTLYFNTQGTANSLRIRDSSYNMVFKDADNWVTLSELNSLPTSISDDWDLDLGAYDISILDSDDDGYYTDNATNSLYLAAGTKVDINAPDTYVDTLEAVRANASDSLCINGDCIGSWSEVEASGNGVGTYYANSSSGKDTIWIPAVIEETPSFDGTDSVDYIPIVYDTLSENMYLVTLSLSTANITDGDSLLLLAAPDAGYQIIPIKSSVRVTGGDFSGGSNNTWIRTFTEADASQNVYTLYYGIYNSGTLTLVDGPSSSYQFYRDTGYNLGVAKPYWVQITGFSSGTGSAVIKMWYTLANYN